MADPVLEGKALPFFRNRYWERTFELFEGDKSPLELALTDVVRCRVWDGSDSDTPYITASTAAATANGSTITVTDLGDDSTTDDPATVVVLLHPDDTKLVPVDADGVVSYLELTVARAAAATKEYVVHRCVLKVRAYPT